MPAISKTRSMAKPRSSLRRAATGILRNLYGLLFFRFHILHDHRRGRDADYFETPLHGHALGRENDLLAIQEECGLLAIDLFGRQAIILRRERHRGWRRRRAWRRRRRRGRMGSEH